MPRASPNQYAFNSGELSPLLDNRSDYEKYANGCRRMRNFLPLPQGPARKRGGSRFVGEVKASLQRTWLVPFVFSNRDAWQLEFGDRTVRFYTSHGQVLEATKNVAAITQAAQGIVTVTSHGWNNGDEIVAAGIGGMTELNGRNFIVSDKTTDTFKLKDLYGQYIDTSAMPAYTSGGSFARVYTLASPYGAADMLNADYTCSLSYAQSGDVLYLCCPGFAVRKLTRAGATSWSFATLDPKAGPFEVEDPDQTTTVYADAETGTVTLTASAAIFTAAHVGGLFQLDRAPTEVNESWEVGKAISAGDVRRSQGHYYEALNSATTGTITPNHTEGSRFDGDSGGSGGGVNWLYLHSGYGWGKITAVGSSSSATMTVLSRLPAGAVGSGNATNRWAFGSWSDAYGHPTSVAFFRERLCFARGTKIWMSVPADFENFAERDAGVVSADSAVSIDIRLGQNNDILWLLSASDLLVGTEGGEFSIGEISTAEALGPNNIASLPGPGYSSRQVQPVKVNDGALYVPASGRKVRDLRFAAGSDGYLATDVTAQCEHLPRGQIVQMAYAREPASIVWAACANGDLLGFTYDPLPPYGVTAGHKHPLGGGGLVESVSTIPSPDGTHDELWMIVRREINGQTKRYVEYFDPEWVEDDGVENAFFVDCGLTYDGAATTTITGLHHLEGEAVSVLAGGRVIPNKTVSGGGFTLDDAASPVHAGFSYRAVLQSMSIEAGAGEGTAQTKIKRIARFFLRLFESMFLSAGPSETSVQPVRNFGVPNTAPPAASTGDAEFAWPGGYERTSYVTVVDENPTPLTVLGFCPDIVTQDRG